MNILDQIIQTKKEEIRSISIDTDQFVVQENKYSLIDRLKQSKLTLIAEVKKASPSKGVIYDDFNPVDLATNFYDNGAGCISVLTDEQYFQGSIQYLLDVREAVDLPILRKDFIIDPIQVYETKQMGANVMLLILDILPVDTANEILRVSKQLKLEVLIEVHDLNCIPKLSALDYVDIVGINNRNLSTFEVNIQHALDFSKILRKLYPDIYFVAESGYKSTFELQDLQDAGLNAVLIGEGLSYDNNLLRWFYVN